MGRDLGYFGSEELDRPELNKCPDCECFFASETCPLCGKLCPEEMRAGHRARVKPPKRRGGSSGRVQFIPWYYSWWFILVMMYVMPVAGLVLFFTSPHSRRSKIIAVSVVVGSFLLLAVGMALVVQYGKSHPYDALPREAYQELCEPMSLEAYHRVAYEEGRLVALELRVVERVERDGLVFYICSDREQGDLRLWVADSRAEVRENFLAGDALRVFGECSGEADFCPSEADGGHHPLVYMAYGDRLP